MAKIVKKIKSKRESEPTTTVAEVTGTPLVSLLNIVKKQTVRYGSHTIENRALPDFRDGLKPVFRRVIWTANDEKMYHNGMLKKSARIVGTCIGKYHPHGDVGTYSALVTMVNMPTPLFDGRDFSNWGDPESDAAAMRYCVSDDSYIFTDKGLKQFSEISGKYDPEKHKIGVPIKLEGLKTPSLDSTWGNISHYVYSGKHELLEIKSDNAPSLKCTKNEPLLVVTPKGFVWRTAENIQLGDILCTNSVVLRPESNNSITCEEAKLLGLIIGDGWITKNTIGFNNTSRSVNNEYRRLAKKYLSEKLNERVIHNPDRKVYRSIEINDTKLVNRVGRVYDLPAGFSRMRYVPNFIFTSNVDVVSSFLSGLFESDGSIWDNQISLSSSSFLLCEQVQMLLLAYYNVRSSVLDDGIDKFRLLISGIGNVKSFLSSIPFISVRKKRLAEGLLNKKISPKAGNSKRGNIPFIDKIGFGTYEVHTTRSKFFENFIAYKSELQEKYRHHYDSKYVYTTVTSIRTLPGKHRVWDLTVENTHAYTCNGYIIHNTECRLSEITQTYLLDPKYLACVPKVPNYDDTLEEPVYLPSKLPMLLLTGAQGIAMACTTLIPSYSFESVKALTKKAIKKGKCTPEMCMDLEFKFTYGGKNTNSEEELLEYYKTGEQKLTFRPNLKIGKNEITVLDLPPNLPASKILSTVSSIEGVRYGKNVHGRGHPEWVEIIPRRKMEARELKSLAHEIANKYTIGLHAKTLVTQRHDDGTTVTFSRTTIPGIVNSWLEWRIAFERKVIEYLLGLERNKLQVNNWLLWAVRNRKLVLSSLESNNPKKYLMDKGKISDEHADYVLNLQVRRLAKIEEKDILGKIKENKEIISGLKHDASSDLNLRKRIYGDF